jgi:uncharacterized protein
MSKLSSEVLSAIEKTMPYCIATASPEAKFNLVYITYLKVLDENTVLIADNKFKKTRKNLDANPQASFVVMDPDTKKAYQIKGPLKCYTEGSIYQETVDWVHVNHPQMTPKAAFIMDVEEVYNGAERLN